MANSGTKNAVMVVIAVGALVGGIYGLSRGVEGRPAPQEDKLQHFVDAGTVESASPVGVTMTVKEFNRHMRESEPIVLSNGSRDIMPAGICPTDGRYYALVGHAQMPSNCPHCDTDLSGYDVNGQPSR
ncbi:MAG: hypothetical protein AAGB48_09400 [Planctomycetota bacterium]